MHHTSGVAVATRSSSLSGQLRPLTDDSEFPPKRTFGRLLCAAGLPSSVTSCGRCSMPPSLPRSTVDECQYRNPWAWDWGTSSPTRRLLRWT